MNGKSIIFFDGVCNLCNGFVDFVIARDDKDLFVFAPLQGETAKEKLDKSYLENLWSVVVIGVDGKVYTQSQAALYVLKELGFVYKVIYYIAKILPLFLKEAIYKLIAKNRYWLFGKRETCRLPTPEERAKFLD